VVAYVRSVAAVRNEMPAPAYKAPMHAELVPGGETSIGETVPADPVKRGFYFATVAHCMECPGGARTAARTTRTGGARAAAEFKGPWGQTMARNISAHKEKGVGAWTDAEIRRALTHGVVRDGRAFKLPMARQVYFSKMTDADLDAIVAWVRTISPVE
jgi:hypothetical protein